MKSDTERVKFALGFADPNTNLAGLGKDEWNGLLRDVLGLLGGEASAAYPPDAFLSWKEREITPLTLASARGALQHLFLRIAAENWRIQHGEIPLWGAGGTVVSSDIRVSAVVDPATKAAKKYQLYIPVEPAAVSAVSFDLLGSGKPRLLGSSIKDACLFAVAESLSGVTVSYIRRCPACTRIFLADDNRQKFCSSRCASRERKSQLRAKKKQETANLSPLETGRSGVLLSKSQKQKKAKVKRTGRQKPKQTKEV